MQFLLDCSVLQDVIVAVQMNGHGGDVLKHPFHITRTFVYNVHKTKMKFSAVDRSEKLDFGPNLDLYLKWSDFGPKNWSKSDFRFL